MNFKKNYVSLIFIFTLIFAPAGFVSSSEERLADHPVSFSDIFSAKKRAFSLNLVSHRELKDRLLHILSDSEDFEANRSFINSNQMTVMINEFYSSFFDHYARYPRIETAEYFAESFRTYVDSFTRGRIDSKALDEVQIMALDILTKKHLSCSAFLNSKN